VWYAKHLRGVSVRTITLPVSSHLVIAIGVGVQLAVVFELEVNALGKTVHPLLSAYINKIFHFLLYLFVKQIIYFSFNSRHVN